MKTFYVESILCDYTCGIIIVSAESKEQAIEMILDKKNQGFDDDSKAGYLFTKYDKADIETVKNHIQELQPNQIVAVMGGG